MDDSPYAEVKEIRRLWRAEDFKGALEAVERLLEANAVSPYLLAQKAMLIQLRDEENGPTMAEAEACLRAALEIDPGNMEVNMELAHWYDAICPDRELAVKHAEAAIRDLEAGLKEMRELLENL